MSVQVSDWGSVSSCRETQRVCCAAVFRRWRPRIAAATVARGLVEADLEGLSSHGVMLVDMYIERLQKGSVSRNETLRSYRNARARSFSMPDMRSGN